jgi:hypothetical protein
MELPKGMSIYMGMIRTLWDLIAQIPTLGQLGPSQRPFTLFMRSKARRPFTLLTNFKAVLLTLGVDW